MNIDHDDSSAQTTNGQADWHAERNYVTSSNHHRTDDKVIQTPGGHFGVNEPTTVEDATADNYTDDCPGSVTDTKTVAEPHAHTAAVNAIITRGTAERRNQEADGQNGEQKCANYFDGQSDTFTQTARTQ